ncbi:MAG: NAD+ synthase, partial [Parachlamydiaceae bacterium]|nr:NAD+ synthase [Parachlamydiaceae bacterium]
FGEIIPMNTITKPPSAELRPNQLDSQSLPHYDIVDNVVEAYVEQGTSKELIVEKFGYSAELVEGLIQKIHRNEYKRRQSPLGLRVTQKAFTAGRHFPIVQGFVY